MKREYGWYVVSGFSRTVVGHSFSATDRPGTQPARRVRLKADTTSITLGLTLAAALAWLYAGVMTGLAAEWSSSPDASYGVLLALIALAVAWRRRDAFARAADQDAPAAPGLAVLLAGLSLYLAGQLGADLFLTRISLVAVLTGAAWFLAGPRAVRVVAAPLLFLLIAVPLPALVVNAITLPLQLTASRVAETTLAAIGVPVFRDGNVLELPSTALEVAEACSGLRSIVSLSAIGVLLAWADTSLPRRLAIVASTVPVAIAMNGLRIVATGLACEAWGPRAASGSWHAFSGWITFVASIALLVQLQRALTRVRFTAVSWSSGAIGA
jgi:exosortase